MALFIKVIVFSVNHLPTGGDCFSVFSEVIPESVRGLIVPFLSIFSDPAIHNALSVSVNVVLVNHRGACQTAIFPKIIPLAVLLFPGVGEIVAVAVAVAELSVFLHPSGRCTECSLHRARNPCRDRRKNRGENRRCG